MAYKAPIWEDGKSPAISAENLNNLSQAAEGAQVLCGNSAPTSSTEGAVGQFYLVVVADSDGNYPLYQCVAIANGSYTWRDTRRIPDSITSMLGIPAPGTINRALNVLANIGNLHVWERVQGGVTDYLTSTDPNAYPKQSAEGGQDAHYTLGDVVSNVSFGADRNTYIHYDVSDSVVVDESGNVTLGDTARIVIGYGYNGTTDTVKSALAGKFIKVYANEYSGSSDTHTFIPNNTIVYIPSDVSITQDGLGPKHFMGSYQPVIGHAAIPANTTITYLGQLGGGARIEVGSYEGTGTYGSSNPNSLTFGFEPQLVAIFNPAQNGNYAYKMFMLRNVLGASVLAGDGNNLGVIVTWSAKSVTWYTYQSKDADYQMNYPGETYNYIAIG